MPQERGYEPQTAPREGQAMPSPSAAAYGAGFGGDLAQAGERLHAVKIDQYKRERQLTAQREAADFAHRYALHRQNMDGIARERRANAAPGAMGHTKSVLEADQAAQESLLAGITDDEVRRHATAQIDEYRTRLGEVEGNYEEWQRIGKLASDVGSSTDIAANRIASSEDPTVYAQEQRLQYQAIDAMPGLPADVRDRLKREQVDQKLGVAYVNKLNETNPQAALAMLNAGTFDTVLEPGQIEQLRNGAHVEIRRAEAAVQHAAALAHSQLTEQVATVTQLAKDGIDVSAQLPQLIAASAAAGDTSTVARLQGLGRDNVFAQVWNGATPLQREARVRELGTIAESQRTTAQQAELAWLARKSGPLDSQFQQDPVGFAIAHAPAGMKPPGLDQGMAARAQWVRDVRGAYGDVNPLSGNEVAAFKNRVAQGDAGYREVMGTLAGLPPRLAKMGARQIAPDDLDMQQLVMLPEPVRRAAIDGKAALTANSKLAEAADVDEKAAIATATNGLHQALAMVPMTERNAIINVARNIAVGHLARRGGQGGEMTAELWGASLNLALGAVNTDKGRTGGMGRWGGAYFIAPAGWTAEHFTDVVFAKVQADPHNGPVNPDGSAVNLRTARPVIIAPGTYQFFVGDRVVMARGRDGKITSPWQFSVGPRR